MEWAQYRFEGKPVLYGQRVPGNESRIAYHPGALMLVKAGYLPAGPQVK
jgi:hypothetical protein